jgi:predicted nucleic acid-binding protein
VIGADTSFLVALAVKEHPAHPAAWQVFERQIIGGTATMALAPQVLAEFCHVVTDPRRFQDPLDMPGALELCTTWWEASECRRIEVGAEVGTLALAWMRELRLGRKNLLDTLLAATYHRGGVRRVATTNWRDFARYGVFELIDL